MTPPTAPPDWNLLYTDTLGAWGLFLVLTNAAPLEMARPEALRWRGDQLWIYGGTGTATPATAAVWRLTFVDDTDATLVFSLLNAVPHLRVQQYGTQITFLVSDSALPFDWAFVPSSP